MKTPRIGLRTLLLAVLVVAVATVLIQDWYVTKRPLTWQPFSRARLDAALTEGRPVVVSFMAYWTASAASFEIFDVDVPVVRQAIRETDTLCLRADCTNPSDEIDRERERLGLIGIGYTVIYSPHCTQPFRVFSGFGDSEEIAESIRLANRRAPCSESHQVAARGDDKSPP